MGFVILRSIYICKPGPIFTFAPPALSFPFLSLSTRSHNGFLRRSSGQTPFKLRFRPFSLPISLIPSSFESFRCPLPFPHNFSLNWTLPEIAFGQFELLFTFFCSVKLPIRCVNVLCEGICVFHVVFNAFVFIFHF